jgi:hypothetical protein
MRKTALFVLLVVHAALCAAAQPAVSVRYSAAPDRACAFLRGESVQPEWQHELEHREGEFTTAWKAIGPAMIQATEEITGKPFPGEPITVRLLLCSLPSQSIFGVTINMRYALRRFTPTPVPMRYKVDTLFHELLHRFLDAYPIEDSPLLRAHASESRCTRNHLHLLALQKAVMLKLHREPALHDVITIDSQLPGDCYRRAWQIVNASDPGYLEYVAEIRGRLVPGRLIEPAGPSLLHFVCCSFPCRDC